MVISQQLREFHRLFFNFGHSFSELLTHLLLFFEQAFAFLHSKYTTSNTGRRSFHPWLSSSADLFRTRRFLSTCTHSVTIAQWPLNLSTAACCHMPFSQQARSGPSQSSVFRSSVSGFSTTAFWLFHLYGIFVTLTSLLSMWVCSEPVKIHYRPSYWGDPMTRNDWLLAFGYWHLFIIISPQQQ